MRLLDVLDTPALLEVLTDFFGDDRFLVVVTALSSSFHRRWEVQRRDTVWLYTAFLEGQHEPRSPEIGYVAWDMVNALYEEDDCWGI